MTLRFITIDEEFNIRSKFPKAAEFEMVQLSHGVAIQDFENCFVILLMWDQGGNTHWTVTHSQIDGPQATESGTLSHRGFSESEQRGRLEYSINQAFATFTKGWLAKFMPVN